MEKKFNRKLAISLLDPKKYAKKVEKLMEPINSGWVIFWKGKAVKPLLGKNHYYASYEAAIQGIERNIDFHREIIKELTPKIYGFEWNSPEWDQYFRKDLWYDPHYIDGKLHHWTSRKADLTDEEMELRDQLYAEQRQFEGFCSNALKTVFVKQWLEDGTLEIKKV
jgi:hypothetical protein